jgi:hypothetical protein
MASSDSVPLIVRLLTTPIGADEGALTCSDVNTLLDEFTDLQASGQDTDVYHPLVHRHLRVCSGCREEYEALLTMIAMDAGDS